MLHHTDFDTPLNALRSASHWYVAYSGGVDSSVLLHLLRDWRDANPGAPDISAIHINHGLQAAADDWQRHCAAQCRALRVAFIPHAVQVGQRSSQEAAAREARYRVFEEQLPPGAVLFMGHHLDDQVETFFLRLLRGAGVEGLAAMPRQRPLGAGQLVRPLLEYQRDEIERYAACHGLSFITDPSNSDSTLDRNFLRAQLLPLLATRWPAYRQSVTRAIGHMAAAADMVATEVGVVETIHNAMGDPGIALEVLVTSAPEMAAAQLRAWARAHGCQPPDYTVLAEFLRQLRASSTGAPRLHCGSYVLQRYRDGVYLLPQAAAPAASEVFELALGECLEVAGVGVVSLQSAAADGLCLAPGERLLVGWRQRGESCRLPGRSGSRSLKDLMQEWGVPPWWRDRVPLLSLEGELLAIGDLACCESSRFRAAARDGEQLWRPVWERPSGAQSH